MILVVLEVGENQQEQVGSFGKCEGLRGDLWMEMRK